MGPAPSLATYEAAANATYQPQLQAEQTTAAATHTANLNTYNTDKAATGTQYDIQQQTLGNTVKDQAAQIAQTYSQRLLGNFSGLQGNDMGAMFSKANTASTNIETMRTNAINGINNSIANENINYTAGESALVSKYQGLEAGAASSGYNSAVKDYNTQQYQQEQLQLGYDKLNQSARDSAAGRATSASNASSKAQSDYLSQFVANSSKTGLSFKGPNGMAISLGQYASVLGNGDANNMMAIIQNELNSSNNSADIKTLATINRLQNEGHNSSSIINILKDPKNKGQFGTISTGL